MLFTVFGGHGFIGSHLSSYLRNRGHECLVPARDEILRANYPLGHVVYCIGVTADFRRRPFDTVEAHVGLFSELLRRAEFDTLLYLSSARIYQGCRFGEENARVAVDPSNPSDLYNLSKLIAESLCFAMDRPTVRVARLSNVYGPDFSSENFLASVIRDALQEATVTLQTDPASEKDYVHIDDVARALELIALQGCHRLYNVCAGKNVTSGKIVEALHRLTGCATECLPDAPLVRSPRLSNARLRQDFNFSPRLVLGELPTLVEQFRDHLNSGSRAGSSSERDLRT